MAAVSEAAVKAASGADAAATTHPAASTSGSAPATTPEAPVPKSAHPPPLPADFGTPPPALAKAGTTPMGAPPPVRKVSGAQVIEEAPAPKLAGPAAATAVVAAEASDPKAADTPAPTSALPGFISHQALRVAFNPESDEYGQLVVRPLIEGEKAPTGWVTALLVGLEAGNVVLAGD
jgi:hypothetical protein